MKCSICFLGGVFPIQIKKEIEKHSKGCIQYAADALQKALIEGLAVHYNEISIVNLPFVSSFPKYYRRILIPKCKIWCGFRDKAIARGESLSYINVPLIKIISKEKKAYYALKKWGRNTKEQKIIVIYSIHSPLIKAAVRYKNKIDKTTRIILIVPDLPEFMNSRSGMLLKILKSIDGKRLQSLYDYIDGFVLLTEYMKEKLPVGSKPYTVIEGVFQPSNTEVKSSQARKTIFYGGTLAKRYGIMNLVNAFIKIKRPDVILEICGAGDASEEICALMKQHGNISYVGQLPRDEVLQKQQSATLLVNPRTPEGEFTRYSFPSKTMEYLASGVPTLLYKLPGIPEEYYSYCYSLSELGVDALAAKIEEIVSLPEEDLIYMGKKAKAFVYKEKNPEVQCMKIVDLINKVIRL